MYYVQKTLSYIEGIDSTTCRREAGPVIQYSLNKKPMGSKGNTTQREALIVLQEDISRDFVVKMKMLFHLPKESLLQTLLLGSTQVIHYNPKQSVSCKMKMVRKTYLVEF